MHIGIPGLSAVALMAALCFRTVPAAAVAAALCFCPIPAAAQTKPPESASKVKKVMLYNKIGGWIAPVGVAEVTTTLGKIAAAKGFQLVVLDADSVITLDYLKQFQVIVWNNNTNGAASVPRLAARQAILEYVDQGGGWLLIHGAGDHMNTWTGLAEAMGTVSTRTGNNGQAEVVLDSAGRSHRELKWMMDGVPDVFRLEDRWLNFRNTVRPLPGVTVVATSRVIPGIPNILIPAEDGSGDQVYIWAREIGKGRLLYNAIGFGSFKLMEQQDSIVPRLYWENLRYAAGDYQNGCANPASAGYDPAARVHVEAMCTDMHPKVNLGDTTISVRDSLRFAPQSFGMCLHSYQSRYEVAAQAPVDSIPRYLIRITSKEEPFCATAAGYSGPIILLKDLPPGIHRLAFTDSSDFRLSIPDSVRITVLDAHSLSTRSPRMGRMPGRTAVTPPRSVDGRLLRRHPETRGTTPGFRR